MSGDLSDAEAMAAYVATIPTYEAAEAVVRALHGKLISAAGAMIVPNSPPHSPEFRMFNASNENAALKAVPNSAEIMTAMQAMTDARNALRAAWKAVPDAARSALKVHRAQG